MQITSKKRLFSYYFLTFCISILLLVISAELLARLLIPQQTFWLASNIYQAIDNPEINYTLKPNFQGIAFGVDLTTNSLGFRGAEWQISKPTNTFRIALLGDSHAFGYGVPFQDSVGEKLAARLNTQGKQHYEVLNFAVNGYNSRQELAIFRHYVLHYQPDMLIVLASSNDHETALTVDAEGWLRAGQTKVEDKSIEKIQLKTVPWLTRHSRLLLYVHLLKKRYELAQNAPAVTARPLQTTEDWMGVFPAGPVAERLKESVYIPLKSLIKEAKERKITVILANFNAFLDYRQLFSLLADEEHIPTLELLALFPEAHNWHELVAQFSLGWDDHLNGIAHERWAQALFQVIEKHRLNKNM